MRIALVPLALALALLASLGCQPLSDSSASLVSMSSISASIESLSASSASAPVQAAYLADVSRLGEVTVAHDAARDDLLRALGDLALAHGLVDWEAFDPTYAALGDGFRRGGLDEAAVAQLAARLFPGDLRAQRLVSQGTAS